MLVDRIVKETTDISRDFLDMSWWLDEGETITKVVSQTVILGAYGWSDAPYPLQGGEMPYDPFPLEIDSAVVAAGGTQLEVFVSEGSPSLAYTCQFVLDGSSTRRVTIEMGVQVTGVPLGALGSGPLPSYLAVTIADTPPSDPQPGQLWFDSIDPQLYIWYDDPSSSQWVIVTSDKGGLATDAPYDGQVYARQNSVWVVVGSAGGGVGPYLPLDGGGTITDGGIFIDCTASQPVIDGNASSAILVRWTNTSTVGALPPHNGISAPLNVVASDWSGAVQSIWGIAVSMNVYSTQFGAPGVGAWPQHVGGSFTIYKYGNCYVAGVHATSCDLTNNPSSMSGPTHGIEVAHQANADDDGGLSGAPGLRFGIHMSQAARTTTSNGGLPCVFAIGYNHSNGGGAVTKSVLCCLESITYQVVDTRRATAPPGYTDPVAAVRMDGGQIIDFNGTNTVNNTPGWAGPAGSYLQYTANSRLRYMSGGNELFSIRNDGLVQLAGTLFVTTTSGAASLRILEEQFISFDNADNRTLMFTAVGGPQRLAYQSSGVDLFSVSDAGALQIGGTAGPTWTQGSGAPFTTQPIGSIYSRVGGAVGATLYVSRGGGTWAAVAGV